LRKRFYSFIGKHIITFFADCIIAFWPFARQTPGINRKQGRRIMNMELLKEFFMWNTLINLGLFMWTAIMCVYCRGLIYRVHGKMFGLSQDTVNAILYGFLGFYKLVFIVFVLVPWIALVIMC
jgi:hypothetical protein